MTMEHSIDEQKRFYDQRWRGHRFANSLKLARTIAILEALAETEITQPRVLELGSGTGWLCAILAQFGPTMGVELSPEAVEAAKARYPFADFAQADIARWTPDLEPFDVVVSHEVIEHLEDQLQHLTLAKRLLLPGGFLILTTPNADTVRAAESKAAQKPLSDQLIENILTRPELLALVRKAGFRVVRDTTLILGHGSRGMRTIANSPKVRGVLRQLGVLSAFDRRMLAAGAGLHTLVVAQRD